MTVRERPHYFRCRVVSYNIHKGVLFSSGRSSLSKLRGALRDLDADLVFLQEVCGERRAWTLSRKKTREVVSHLAYLSETTWEHAAYGRNMVYNSGHHGNAILSKVPFAEHENFDISTNKVERRGIIHAQIRLPDAAVPLHLFCVHMGLTGRGRGQQLELICGKIRAAVPDSEPIILAGDFNDWLRRASPLLNAELGLREVLQFSSGRYGRTFPAPLPLLHLDRIYVRGLEIVSAEVLSGNPWRKLSDHVPVFAELMLPLPQK